jgi:hypothetical protein
MPNPVCTRVCTNERESGTTADTSLQSLAAAIARLSLEDRAKLVAMLIGVPDKATAFTADRTP